MPDKQKPLTSTPHVSAPYAFTLVELLVTIAIISLLLAIIIPALGRARDQAKLMICKVRLRNICNASLMYADENQSKLPVDDMLGPSYTDGLSGQWIDNPHLSLINALSQKNYLDQPENYYCPSQKNPPYSYSDKNFSAGHIGYFYFSVVHNPISNGGLSTFLRWPEMGVIEYPRRLRSSMHSQTWVVSDMWFSGQPTSHRWFQKGINYALLDSSVQMVQKQPRKEFR